MKQRLKEPQHTSPDWLAPVVTALVTCAVFLPALSNQFVAWDDEATLVNNPYFRGLGWTQLRWMFTTFHMGPYQPLSWMTYGLDYLFWGLNPVGYHLTNVLIHAANALLVFLLTRRLLIAALTLSERDAWTLDLSAVFGALVFAIHPLRVESVAWATERRDVLSGFFFLWTLFFYLQAASSPSRSRRRWLAAAVAAFILSMLSKATGVMLPLVLIVLDVYPMRRLGGGTRGWLSTERRAVLREKLPFLGVAIVFAAVAWLGQRSAQAVGGFPQHDLAAWLGPPLYGLTFYLWKTVAPVRLSPLYELPYYMGPWLPVFIASAIVVAAGSAFCILVRRRWPALLSCWVYYVLLLLPVLGLVQIGPQIVADRYSYLSCLSWSVLAAGVVCRLATIPTGRSRPAAARVMITAAASVGVVCALGAATWRQAGVWRDTRTLWEYVIAVTPDSSIAHYNYGNLLVDLGEPQPAIESYRRSVMLNPARAAPRISLADLLAQHGQPDEAIRNYTEALLIEPNNASGHYGLGSLLATRGDLEESSRHLERGIELRPDTAAAHANLGSVLARQNKARDAIAQFRRALELDPDLDSVRYQLGKTLLQARDMAGAAEQFGILAARRPMVSELHYLQGLALAGSGRLPDGERELREAVRLNPDFADAYLALARALELTGHPDEAAGFQRRGLDLLKSGRGPAPGR